MVKRQTQAKMPENRHFDPRGGSCRCASGHTLASRLVRTLASVIACGLHLLTHLHAGHESHGQATQTASHALLAERLQHLQGPGPGAGAATGQRRGAQALRASHWLPVAWGATPMSPPGSQRATSSSWSAKSQGAQLTKAFSATSDMLTPCAGDSKKSFRASVPKSSTFNPTQSLYRLLYNPFANCAC